MWRHELLQRQGRAPPARQGMCGRSDLGVRHSRHVSDLLLAAPTRVRSGDARIPFDNIRRRTAEHMVRSKATSAHVATAIEVDFEAVERVRRTHGGFYGPATGTAHTALVADFEREIDTLLREAAPTH